MRLSYKWQVGSCGSFALKRARNVKNSNRAVRPQGEGKSGRGLPHSKTWRSNEAPTLARQRLGVRQSSAAFRHPFVCAATPTCNLQPSTCNSRGFTLMELLVVCLLIAVMAAIIVPEMRSSFEDALLRSSGRKLVDVLGLAYSRAISLNQLHRVRLDKFSGEYLVEKQVGDGLDDEDFEPATEITGFKGQIDSRISLDIQNSEADASDDSDLELQNRAMRPSDGICFYSDGTADACEILLRDRMGFQLVLQVSPTTGRVHLVEQTQAASN